MGLDHSAGWFGTSLLQGFISLRLVIISLLRIPTSYLWCVDWWTRTQLVYFNNLCCVSWSLMSHESDSLTVFLLFWDRQLWPEQHCRTLNMDVFSYFFMFGWLKNMFPGPEVLAKFFLWGSSIDFSLENGMYFTYRSHIFFSVPGGKLSTMAGGYGHFFSRTQLYTVWRNMSRTPSCHGRYIFSLSLQKNKKYFHCVVFLHTDVRGSSLE